MAKQTQHKIKNKTMLNKSNAQRQCNAKKKHTHYNNQKQTYSNIVLKAKRNRNAEHLRHLRKNKEIQPATKKNGILKTINNIEILMFISLLINKAIPVTPPSINPFGNKNAFKPILARTIPNRI